MGCSESTVTRDIKLLVEEKLLWAAYNQETKTNKQRVLWIYDEAKAKKVNVKSMSCAEKSPKLGLFDSQNEEELSSNRLPPHATVTASDSQNDALVYNNKKRKNKEINNYNCVDDDGFIYETGEEFGDVNDGCHISDTHIECNSATFGQPSDLKGNIDDTNWNDYFSLSDRERKEIIEDIEMDLISEQDIPLWYRNRQEIMQRQLKKLDYESVDEMPPFLRAVFLSRIGNELEDRLRNDHSEDAII